MFYSIPYDLKNILEQNAINVGDIVLYITGKCNLRCKHCYIGNELLNKNQFYSMESILYTLENFLPLDRLTIIGGEPFLHPNITKLLSKISTMSIKEKRISTNLTYLPAEIISELPIKGIRFCVSIDSHKKIGHNFLRGNGVFEEMLKNLKLLVNKGCDIEINHTVTRININDITKLINFLKLHGIKRLNLHLLSIMGNANNHHYLKVSPTKWRKLISFLRENNSINGTLSIRYELAYATSEEYNKLQNQNLYKHHSEGSFYTENTTKHRIVIYPDKKIYISSEAFSTESYIAQFVKDKTLFNSEKTNEIFLSKNATFNISDIRNTRTGDKQYPIALSVSYRESVKI